MKYTLLFLLLPVTGLAQTTIPPGAKTIIVKGVAFSEVCNALLDSGYSLEKKDAELQVVRTEPKVYPKYWNAAYKINIRVKDSVAYITGTFTAPYEQIFTSAANKTDPLWNNDPVYNHTNKKGKPYPKSMIGYPFILMNRFAQCFGKEVTYSN